MGRRAVVVVGIGYGDEGKGSIVDHLVRKIEARVVVRFNGGAQAAHNVVTPDGRHHTFSQFGAGTFAGARTVLTKDVLVDPLALLEEAKALAGKGVVEPFDLLTIDRQAVVVTPYHRALNRIRELARVDRHGSCGVGIGEAAMDARERPEHVLRVGHLSNIAQLRWRLKELRHRKLAEATALMHGDPIAPMGILFSLLNDAVGEENLVHAMFSVGLRIRDVDYHGTVAAIRRENVVLEGAQGILLDEWRGFHPHTTWSTTTSDNARAFLVNSDFDGDVRVLGVTRTYATRHGAGPFPTWDEAIEYAGEHNQDHDWQGGFRRGSFDAVTARYALAVDPAIDALAVTCCDHAPGYACEKYTGGVRGLKLGPARDLAYQEGLTKFLRSARGWTIPVAKEDMPAWIGAQLGRRVVIESHGPTTDDKRWKGPL